MKTQGSGRTLAVRLAEDKFPTLGKRLAEVQAQRLVKQLVDKLAEV